MAGQGKYFAHKVRTTDGEFDSKREWERFQELKLELKAGYIQCLHRQVSFEILPQMLFEVRKQLKTKVKIEYRVDEKAKHYTPDFVYYDTQSNVYVMEEVKSFITAKARDYNLRRHLIKLIIKKHNKNRKTQWVFKEIK